MGAREHCHQSANGAFSHCPTCTWASVSLGYLLMANALADLGFLSVCEYKKEHVAALTDKARQPGRLISFWQLRDPKPFLASPREHVALSDRTSYEYLLMLLDDGWEWRKWVRNNKQDADASHIVGYTPGQPKVFFSNCTEIFPVCRFYLLALLRAEDIL